MMMKIEILLISIKITIYVQPTAKKFTYSILYHLYKNTGRATIYRKRIGTWRSSFACDKKKI